MKNNKIIIGSDHAGFNLKNSIIKYLTENNYEIDDIGCHSTDAIDYPIIAKQLAKKISNNEYEKGILICGSGIGMSIAANKVKGVRAVVCSDTTSAKFSRLHNNANVLCLGERIIGEYLAKDICNIWLNTQFEEARHAKRVSMLEEN
ncbi:ribose 5-phosphate isomerase B [bacterium]|nr:ribose 5-phosphate isomerase B [bacterium]